MPLTPEAIDAWLPQTQCTRCGFPSCRAYAEAIVAGAADFNQCPPGGDITLNALAALLHCPPKALNPAYGPTLARQRAVIDEPVCIGCRKCLEVCPIDAIIGARQMMHSVLDVECNGCGLCVPVCPVDCIALLPVVFVSTGPWPEYNQSEADHWRRRTEARRLRLQKIVKPPRTLKKIATTESERMRAEIRAAVARVRAKKSARRKGHA